MLGMLPSELLLLLKTNDCLRHIDKQLGTPVNSATGIYTNNYVYMSLCIFIYVYMYMNLFVIENKS
jgi:hypothetical protein